MILQGQLPTGKTVKSREFTYVSTPKGSVYDGLLMVTDLKGRKTIQRAYHVARQPDDSGDQVFLLLPDHREDGEVYESRFDVSQARPPRCTCKAGQVGRYTCVHVEAITHLLNQGLLTQGAPRVRTPV